MEHNNEYKILSDQIDLLTKLSAKLDIPIITTMQPLSKLIFTSEPPNKPGYYWYCNFGEHTPTILNVEKIHKGLYASNEEFGFLIEYKIEQQELDLRNDDEDEYVADTDTNGTKYKHGDELWCYIPNPYLPCGEKQVTPDCY